MAGKTYKKPTEFSAIQTLQRFFEKYPDSNLITPEQALESAGRNTPEYERKNEGWLSNKLTGLYFHGLVKPNYSFHPWRKLESLELTQKGKTVLNREDAPGVVAPEGYEYHEQASVALQQSPQPRDLTIDEILEALPRINERLTTHKLKVTLEEVQDRP